MARQSRQQRRERRAQGPQAALAGAPPAAPPRRPTAVGGPEPRREPHREPHVVPGSGLVHFMRESVGELKKVEWPGQKQVITGTMVVLIACLIVGVFLYGSDLVFKRVVEHLFVK